MAGISLEVVSTKRPDLSVKDEPKPRVCRGLETPRDPRESYYDTEASSDLLRRGIAVRPNRLVHEHGNRKMERFLKRMEKSPEVLEQEIQRRRGLTAKVVSARSWWSWNSWSSK